MKIAAFVALVCIAVLGLNTAFAADALLAPGGASWHPDKAYSNTHPGVLAGRRSDAHHALIGGVLRNSERRTSVLATYRYTPVELGPVRIGGHLGAATGYRRAPIVPIAGLAVAADVGPLEVSLVAAPTVRAVDFCGHVTVFVAIVF